jgi:hypothetical protein
VLQRSRASQRAEAHICRFMWFDTPELSCKGAEKASNRRTIRDLERHDTSQAQQLPSPGVLEWRRSWVYQHNDERRGDVPGRSLDDDGRGCIDARRLAGV